MSAMQQLVEEDPMQPDEEAALEALQTRLAAMTTREEKLKEVGAHFEKEFLISNAWKLGRFMNVIGGDTDTGLRAAFVQTGLLKSRYAFDRTPCRACEKEMEKGKGLQCSKCRLVVYCSKVR